MKTFNHFRNKAEQYWRRKFELKIPSTKIFNDEHNDLNDEF